MNVRQLKTLGIPDGERARLAVKLIGPAIHAGLGKGELRQRIKAVIDEPAAHLADPHFAELARALLPADHPDAPQADASDLPRLTPAPWRQWGADLDPAAVQQMRNACELPVSVAGALMPDAHVGYGLPIGGVLATENAVIPYAVGVDIACRMKLTVLDLPPHTLEKRRDWLTRAIEDETRFGVGAAFGRTSGPSGSPKGHRQHEVMDRDWSVTRTTRELKDKAQAQLGTSGSGNHFVEFGELTLEREALGLAPGTYVALLTHSGSRGAGASVASHYSNLAMRLHPKLPQHLRHLAWLDLDREEGQEYWAAMELMGEYAAANHAVIHRSIAKHLGAGVLLDVENHHNFAWKERHALPGGGELREVIVHRKGATPAGAGVLGIIPGSMASPGFLVRGKGEPASLGSASHGAGRVMSRTQARNTYNWAGVRDFLRNRNVTLLSAGIDEAPMVYKDIHAVMGQQADLVEVVARFDPRLVKMAPEGEKAED